MLPPPPRSRQSEASADSTLTDSDIMQWLEPHALGHPEDVFLMMQLQYGSFSNLSTSTGSHLDLHKMAEDVAD